MCPAPIRNQSWGMFMCGVICFEKIWVDCMKKTRLEAFSDGLFSVVITIMVLELVAPDGVSLQSLGPQIPIFLSYVLSFLYVAISWVNHHHLLMATKRINTHVLWANLGFLFFVSLIPFFTSWVDENHVSSVPVAAYGMSLFMVIVSYRVLELVLFRLHDASAPIVRVLRPGRREKISMAVMLAGVAVAFVQPFVALAIYIAVAVIWIRPERGLEKALSRGDRRPVK